MSARRLIRSSFAGLLALAAAGCSGGPSASATIGPSGGTLTLSDGSSLVVPPGALTSPTSVSMAATSLPSAITESPGPGVVGQAYQLGPEGLQLAAPAVVTIALTAAQLQGDLAQGQGLVTNSLALLTTGVGTTDHGYTLTTSVATDPSHVAGATSHFSWVWVATDVSARFSTYPSFRPANTGCGDGPGGLMCVSFGPTDACPSCECLNGYPCPDGGAGSCCACPGGTACPFDEAGNCGLCGADAG